MQTASSCIGMRLWPLAACAPALLAALGLSQLGCEGSKKAESKSAAESVQPLFITVDPERDTPARLADFVSSFHPRLIGLTGSLADIRKTAIAYRTFFVKIGASTSGGDYSVDHTGFIYLVGKDGRYLGFLPPGSTPDAIADAIRARLGAE